MSPRTALAALRARLADRRARHQRLALLTLDEHRLRDIGAPDAVVQAARAFRAADARLRAHRRLDGIGW